MRTRNFLATALLLLTGLHGCSRQPAPPPTPPVVAGLGLADLDPVGRGLVLLEELGCVACHAPADTSTADPSTAATPHGPDLATVGARVTASYLRGFVADPCGSEPGTTMPDLLRDLGDDERITAARQLADYVRSFLPPAASPAAALIEPTRGQRGRELYHTIGCAMCHAPHDGVGDLPVGHSVPMAPLAAKYTVSSLREFLLAPLVARPSGRMPDLGLTASEADDLAHYLHGMTPDVEPEPVPPPPDAAQVALGRTAFAARGCANCHALADPARPASPQPKALRDLAPERGCLSAKVGAFPWYPLSDEQRADLRAALAGLSTPRTGEQQIRQQLAARNCLACHARDEIGGVRAERNRLCTSNDPSLGQESRLPPALTGVGAKLQRDWLRDAIAHGQRERPYLRTRMPAFGTSVAEPLTALLARTDTLPAIALAPSPAGDESRRAVLDLGRTLAGEQGMNCIACHTFAGEKVGALAAIDLVATTGRRLRPDWFAHFLRHPFRWKPGTVMPQFFPDGVSTRPDLGDGSAQAQIGALWHYLAEGRNVGKPSGMRRAPIELAVGDEAVLLRRSVENTGKRGISVGLPHGVNLTFDAERLGMNQLWWGPFVEASGVWTSQGSGEMRILGKDRVALPPGPSCAILPTADAPWPTATRRELGHRWLGYDLDAEHRPTFRYTCGEVTIDDAVQEHVAADAPTQMRPRLRRTLRCSGPTGTLVTFLVARAARIASLGDDRVQVDATLRLHLPATAHRILPAGDQQELRITLPLVDGRAECRIDYEFVEAGK